MVAGPPLPVAAARAMLPRMVGTRQGGHSHVLSADLLGDPPMTRPLLWGGAAAMLGAAIWAALNFFADLELGYLAWGIGALVGFAIVKGGGHGTLLAASAAILAVLAIGTGKYAAFQLQMERQIDAVVAGVDAKMLTDRLAQAEDWVALGEHPDKAAISAYLLDHDLGELDPDTFAAQEGPGLRQQVTTKPTLEQWRKQLRDEISGQVGFADFVRALRAGFHPLDIVFVVLGLMSAFGIVSRHTTSLRTMARQQLRAARDEAAVATTPSE